MKKLIDEIMDGGLKLRGYRRKGWSGRMKRAFRNVKTFCCACDFRKNRIFMMTLTSSRESGGDIHRSWEALKQRIRRGYHRKRKQVSKFEYVLVRTNEGVKGVLHVLFYGTFISHGWLSRVWKDIHGVSVVWLKEVRKRKRRRLYMYLVHYVARIGS